MKKRWRAKPSTVSLGPEIRFAVLDHVHQEIYSQHHKVIGEAFNSRDEDYIPNHSIIVVAHFGDKIIGEVNRDGSLKKIQKHKLPATIWSAPLNNFFNPNIKYEDVKHK